MQILAGTIDQEGQRTNTQMFISRFRPVFPVGLSTNDEFRALAQWSMMQQAFVPYMVFVDAKGQIRAQYMGNHEFFQREAANIRKMLDQLLAEGKPAGPAKPSAAAGKAAATPKK